MPEATTRLDAELVRRGLARSRRRASELVTGGHVRVEGAVAHKPSQRVSPDHPVTVHQDRDDYVSRGAHKLAGGLDGIERLAPGGLRIAGSRCLDAGASTGGFTQVLLERGARDVIAVDVGHGQIAPRLAADPRVTVREGTDVRELSPEELGEPVDLVVADLSFISLTLVMRTLVGLTARTGSLLVMVKPQFEVGRGHVSTSGVVSSPDLRERAVLAVAASAAESGGVLRAVVPSPLPGSAGNREYFCWVTRGDVVDAGGGVGGALAGGGDGGAAAAAAVTDAVRRAVRDGEPALTRDSTRAPASGRVRP